MRNIKLFEAFQSSTLSKVFSYFKKDKQFKSAFDNICNANDIPSSQLTDDDVEYYTTSQYFNNYESLKEEKHISFWFNDQLGLCIITNQNFDRTSNIKTVPGFDGRALGDAKINTYKSSFDICIVLYLSGHNSKRQIKIDRSGNQPLDRIDNERYSLENKNKYILAMLDRIDITPEDSSILLNFKKHINKYFTKIDPILFFGKSSEHSNDRLINLIKIYIKIIENIYDCETVEEMEDLDIQRDILSLKDKYKTILNTKQCKLINETDLLTSDYVLNLEEKDREKLSLIYDINNSLKEKILNYKFETVYDIYAFKNILVNVNLGDYINTDILFYMRKRDFDINIQKEIENSINNIKYYISGARISQLKLYKNIVERSLKN